MRLGVAVLLLTVSGGCAATTPRVVLVPRCADGLPPRLLLDVRCPPNGICGYSCHPARWTLGTLGCPVP